MKLVYATSTMTTDFAIIEIAGQGMNYRDRRTLVCIEVPAGRLSEVNWSTQRRLASIPGCREISRTQVLMLQSKFNDSAIAMGRVQDALDHLADERRQKEHQTSLGSIT